jgi:hypothetical protein
MPTSSSDVENMIVKISLGTPKDESGFPMDQKEYSDLWDSLSKQVEEMSKRGVLVEPSFEFAEVPDMGPEERAKLLEDKKKIQPEIGEKSLGRRLGRAARRVPFIPNARDRDGDGLVQEGTSHERPAKPSGKPDVGKPQSTSVVGTPRARRRLARDFATELSDDISFFSGGKKKPKLQGSQTSNITNEGPPKGRTSGRSLTNRLNQMETEVKERFGPISSRKEAFDALKQAYPFADIDELMLSETLTNAERGGVTALLHLALNYPKTAESIDEFKTQLDLGTSGRFSVRSGFSDDGSSLALNNNVAYGRTFDDFVSVVKKRVAEEKKTNPNKSRWFLVSDEIEASDDIDEDEKARLIAASLVIHEFGHAWHERSTKPVAKDGEEMDPIEYVAAATRMKPEDFEKYMRQSIMQTVGSAGLPQRPDVSNLPEAERSKALAEYNKQRKKIISEAFKRALQAFLNDTKRSLSEYRDDGLSKKQVGELVASSTTSEYAGKNFAEAIAESFTADYLGISYSKPEHYETIWNYMSQVKAAKMESAETLPDGTIIETDEDGNIFIVNEVCGGLEKTFNYN